VRFFAGEVCEVPCQPLGYLVTMKASPVSAVLAFFISRP
jgi:hypothetical protein